MGTRADFYIGTGEQAKWIGSVAWDGYQWEEQPDCPLMKATTENEFIAAVADISADRDDWTSPEQCWPWPWDDSFTTDRTYAFVDGKTMAFHWGKTPSPDGDDGLVRTVEWPNMADTKNVAEGKRSGTIVVNLQTGEVI